MIVFLILVLLLATFCFFYVPKGNVFLVRDFRNRQHVWMPGFHFMVPEINRNIEVVPTVGNHYSFSQVSFITGDKAFISAAFDVEFSIKKPEAYDYGSEHDFRQREAIETIAKTVMKKTGFSEVLGRYQSIEEKIFSALTDSDKLPDIQIDSVTIKRTELI